MQKFIYLMGLQLIALSYCTSTFATVLPSNSPSKHQFSLGLEFFHYNYREPGYMTTKGPLGGINGAYNFTFSNGFFLQPDLRIAFGRTEYKSNRTGRSIGKDFSNMLFETRFLFGKKFNLGEKTQLIPFLGVGYRFKSDDSRRVITTTGHHGYYRDSQYLYIPLGLTLHQQINHCWSLSPTLEFDWFLHGHQYSGIYGGLHHHQEKGFGFRGDLMVTCKFRKGSLSFGPFINYWNIRDSDIVWVPSRRAYYIEPYNQTTEAGIKIKYNF